MKTTYFRNKDKGYSVKAYKEGQHIYFLADDVSDGFGFTEDEKYSLIDGDCGEHEEHYMPISSIINVCDKLKECNCYTNRVRDYYEWIVHIIKCEEFGTEDYNRVVPDKDYLETNDNDDDCTIAVKKRLKELDATKQEIEAAIKIERQKLIAEVFEMYGLVEL